MDTASCGRFELTFEFKLFAIGVSVPGPFLLFYIKTHTHAYLHTRTHIHSRVLLQSLTEGSLWDYFADLLNIMKLREVGTDDEKEVREIVPHLCTNIVKPARSKRDSQ